MRLTPLNFILFYRLKGKTTTKIGFCDIIKQNQIKVRFISWDYPFKGTLAWYILTIFTITLFPWISPRIDSWKIPSCYCLFKWSVSRVLRWVLLYINQKLFSRPIIASHKILTFLNGQFTINKKQAGATLYYDMVLSKQYWNRRKMGVSAILKFATAPLSDMISRKSTDPPYCWFFSWFYEFILRKWRHFRIPVWRKRTVSVISSHSEEPVAHFNITNLNKSAEDISPDKKAPPDLNL